VERERSERGTGGKGTPPQSPALQGLNHCHTIGYRQIFFIVQPLQGWER